MQLSNEAFMIGLVGAATYLAVFYLLGMISPSTGSITIRTK